MAVAESIRRFRSVHAKAKRFDAMVEEFNAEAGRARERCNGSARGQVVVPRDLLERAISALDDGTANRQIAIALSALTESEAP